MKKVAIIRGPNLNKFEMQSYEPLTKYFDITGYTTHNHNFEIDQINFKVKKLHCIEELTNRFSLSGAISLLLYKYGYIQYMFGLEKELQDKDIAHAAEIRNAYSYQAVKAKRDNRKLRVVLTVWENIPYLSWRVPPISSNLEFNRKVTEKIIQNTDAFIAITNRAKEALILEGIPEEKIHVIPAGVDVNRFKPGEKDSSLLKQLGIAEDEVVLLFVGRIVWEKGIHSLIYAFKKLLADPSIADRKLKLIVIGNGPERNEITKIVDRLNLSQKIITIPNVSYMAIHKFYNIADIFILPSIPTYSWQEQFGMVLAEAMAAGLPVIAALSGSIPEVVGDAGILTQPGDFLDLYTKLKELVMHPDLREKFSKKARKRAERVFNHKIISEEIRKVYESVLK